MERLNNCSRREGERVWQQRFEENIGRQTD